MRIHHAHIKNFKSIRDLAFTVQALQAFIGENNSGKSNILEALELFLSGSIRKITETSFNDSSGPIEVKITFTQLADWETERFAQYVAAGELALALTVTWDADKRNASNEYHGFTREPKEDYLKESKLGTFTLQDLREFVTTKSLPDYFLAENGKVTKKSYRQGILRYLRGNADVVLEPPERAIANMLVPFPVREFRGS